MKIYLDNNSTTKVDPLVLEAVNDVFTTHYGNPSSIHVLGQKAKQLLNKSRTTIADFLDVRPGEIIFTSSATEAINLILRGHFTLRGGHLITSSVEHAAVFRTALSLQKEGVEVSFLETGEYGAVVPEKVKEAIKSNTRMIALMSVNNETGVKTNVEAIAAIAEEAKIPFFVDGVAQLGKESLVIPKGVSAMTFSGHKIHAPKGIGFAYVHRSLKITPQITGGPQENDKRGGTENLPGIVGMAKAVELLSLVMPENVKKMEKLRDLLEQGILTKLPFTVVNGSGPRVCNTSNIAFIGYEGEVLLAKLDMKGIFVSHGSACSSGAIEPSRVLLNMGFSTERAQSSIRFSLSRYTTEEEIKGCLSELDNIFFS